MYVTQELDDSKCELDRNPHNINPMDVGTVPVTWGCFDSNLAHRLIDASRIMNPYETSALSALTLSNEALFSGNPEAIVSSLVFGDYFSSIRYNFDLAGLDSHPTVPRRCEFVIFFE